MTDYDVVVIGAGTGGYVAAIRAAQLGLKTAVVEKQKALGGTCLLVGCIPTKALLEHAHALKVVQHAKDWGVAIGDASAGSGAPRVSIDMAQVQTRKDRVVTGLTKGVEFLFKKNRIDWIKGTARLTGNGGVDVFEGDRQTLRARREIIVATGSTPRSVPGVEIDRRRIITSDEAVALREVPKSIAIMGSGAVGVEFASIFRRFGSDVTILELLPRLVPVEDQAVSEELEKAFRRQGITSHTNAKVTSARATADGVDLQFQKSDGAAEKLRADYLLVATGRGPVTAGLDAERIGIDLETGYVRVDAGYRTSVQGISAIGDVITMGGPHPQLAHVSSAEGVIAAERIAGRTVRPLNYDHVPGCTYCDPEIGSVGLTEREAARRGYDVRTGTFPFGVLGRAKIAGETDGFVKIVADKKYDEVLGIHMIGLRATELVAEAVVALRLESTVEELIRTIHAHPTMAEAVGEAAHAVHGAAIHL
ncbi:MAG: dihydrolipoyl dehydrogenase [Acidobacteria bacterium]|nr:MAG: dihydrolipoyl dehydrogenase [Acidobacteriota bacterium]PYQ88123.1 MAG: dihydrolipoyl dehydrogenase [Acidobacteriota bacterium]